MATHPLRPSRNGTIVHKSHFIADESLDIKGTLCIGGNLEVHGDLKADRVFCFGTIRVHGSIRVQELVSGFGIYCDGSITTNLLKVGYSENDGDSGSFDWHTFAEEFGHEVFPNVKSLLNRLTDTETLAELDSLLPYDGVFDPEYSVTCGDDLICIWIDIPRGISAGGVFNPDDATINGDVDVGRLCCEGDLDMSGSLSVSGNAEVQGSLWVGGLIYCTGTLTTWGNLEAVDMEVRGDIDSCGIISALEGIESREKILSEGKISAGKYIKAGGLIASKGSIQAGKDYGIFAGLELPRLEWPDRGYVCTSIEPQNIFSGVYVTRKQKRPWKNQ